MHDQVQSDDDLQTAFEVLAGVVEEMHAAGRRTYSASVKPQLLTRTNGGFDEHKIGPGFASFRAFLNAAADAGVVTVAKAPVGPDVEILPPGATSLGPRREPRRGGVDSRRIRKDLWDAFIDWAPGKLRAFDRLNGVAQVVSAESAPLGPARQTALRRAILGDEGRWVQITPVSLDRQQEIMSEFVETLPPTEERAALETALRARTPFRAFRGALAIDSRLGEAYRAFRLDAVVAVIDEWKSANGVDADVFVPTAHPPTVERGASDPDLAHDAEAAARQLMHSAIERMPLEELNRVHIPVEYYIES